MNRIIIIVFLVTLNLPVAFSQRGRVQVTGSNSVVTDNGSLLRGGTVRLKKDQTGYEWATNPEVFKIAKQNHLNAIRVTCDYRPWKGEKATYTLDEFEKFLDIIVKNAKDHNMYVLIDWHDDPGTYKLEHGLEFWKRFAPRYKNEKHVLYELVNEPVKWKAEDYTEDHLKDIKKLYKTVRKLAPDTHINMLCFPTHTPVMLEVAKKLKGIDWKKTSIGFHTYHISTSSGIKELKAQFPVIDTEYCFDCTVSPKGGLDGYQHQAERLEQLGVSWFAWDYIQNEKEVQNKLLPAVQEAKEKCYGWVK